MAILINSVIGGLSWVDFVWMTTPTVRLQEWLVKSKEANAPITFEEIVMVMIKWKIRITKTIGENELRLRLRVYPVRMRSTSDENIKDCNMRYDGATRGLTIFGSKRQLMVVRWGGMVEGAKLNWPELRRISAYQHNFCWYERYTILWSFGFWFCWLHLRKPPYYSWKAKKIFCTLTDLDSFCRRCT